VTAGSYATRCTCSSTASDGFIAKLPPDGSRLLWSTFLSRQSSPSNSLESDIRINTIAVDITGSIVAGGSAPSGFPVTSGAVQTSDPGSDAGTPYAGFVTELDSAATHLVFSTYFGSASLLSGGVQALAVDSRNGIWLTGLSVPSALPGAAAQPALGPSYVASLSPDGSAVSTVFTAPAGAAGQALVVSQAENFAVLGPAGSLLLSAPANSPSVAGVASSAGDSISATVAPAELISFYGYNLGPSTPAGAQVINGVVTNSLDGFEVQFNGIPAPLFYVGLNQINCVVPSEVYAQGMATVQIRTPQGTFSGPALFLSPSSPGIFHESNGFAFALNQDRTVNSESRPAAPGSIVAVWATGAGLRIGNGFPPDGTVIQAGQLGHPALPVSILSGGQSLEVLYAGDAPDAVFGALQVNFRLPESFPSGATSVAVQLQVGSAVSGGVSIYVRP
jgi:uncharacterized protein (TIGR03437 family)